VQAQETHYRQDVAGSGAAVLDRQFTARLPRSDGLVRPAHLQGDLGAGVSQANHQDGAVLQPAPIPVGGSVELDSAACQLRGEGRNLGFLAGSGSDDGVPCLPAAAVGRCHEVAAFTPQAFHPGSVEHGQGVPAGVAFQVSGQFVALNGGPYFSATVRTRGS
jgi:hypothetical protein